MALTVVLERDDAAERLATARAGRACPLRIGGECAAAGRSRTERHPAGTVLLRQGETPDRVLVLQSGWIVIARLYEDGRRHIQRFALPGDVLGFAGPAPAAMTGSAEAMTAVTVCSIGHDALCALCREEPEVALSIAGLAARDALRAWDDAGVLACGTARERVARLLHGLYRRTMARAGCPPDGPMRLPLSQVTIAEATGLSAVHVCRTMKGMRLDRLLEFRKGTLHLLDPVRLERIALCEDDGRGPSPRPGGTEPHAAPRCAP